MHEIFEEDGDLESSERELPSDSRVRDEGLDAKMVCFVNLTVLDDNYSFMT